MKPRPLHHRDPSGPTPRPGLCGWPGLDPDWGCLLPRVVVVPIFAQKNQRSSKYQNETEFKRISCFLSVEVLKF